MTGEAGGNPAGTLERTETPAKNMRTARPSWAKFTDENGAHWSHWPDDDSPATMTQTADGAPVILVNDSSQDGQRSPAEAAELRDELAHLIRKAGMPAENKRLGKLRKLAASQERSIYPSNNNRDPNSDSFGRYMLSGVKHPERSWVDFDRMTLDHIEQLLTANPSFMNANKYDELSDAALCGRIIELLAPGTGLSRCLESDRAWSELHEMPNRDRLLVLMAAMVDEERKSRGKIA
jgi:hypothetical protein